MTSTTDTPNKAPPSEGLTFAPTIETTRTHWGIQCELNRHAPSTDH